MLITIYYYYTLVAQPSYKMWQFVFFVVHSWNLAQKLPKGSWVGNLRGKVGHVGQVCQIQDGVQRPFFPTNNILFKKTPKPSLQLCCFTTAFLFVIKFHKIWYITQRASVTWHAKNSRWRPAVTLRMTNFSKWLPNRRSNCVASSQLFCS